MLKLYYYPYSQNSRRVISLLEENSIGYTKVLVDMEKREYLSTDYVALNPNAQVPTMVDEDVILHESNAILRYICNKFSLESWYPSDVVKRGYVEQWLDWNQCRLAPIATQIVLNKVFLKEHGDETAIQDGLVKLPTLVSIMESTLESTPYFAGNDISIADLSIASNISHLRLAEVAPDRKAINEWYKKVSSLKGFKMSLPPHMS